MATENREIRLIREAIENNDLVVVFGTGVSMSLTNGRIPSLSWRGLVSSGFAECERLGKASAAQVASWSAQLNSSDIDDLLAAAEFVTRKLQGPTGELYGQWLKRELLDARPDNEDMISSLRLIAKSGVPIATLNYDLLAEQSLSISGTTLADKQTVSDWLSRRSQTILHLHGICTSPDTCVLGIRDYEATVKDEIRHLVQRTLGAFKRLLFVGCGDTFSDPNFSVLVKWLKQHLGAATPEHFALVKSDELAKRQADPTWHGFVTPVAFGKAHGDLATFLSDLFAGSNTSANLGLPGVVSVFPLEPTSNQTLEEYRNFILADCGQMTIEGIRADLDTTQRKFDIEKLFVPLEVNPLPPEIPDSDPNRAEKLEKWHSENRISRPFGEVFKERSRIALLALPGGGRLFF